MRKSLTKENEELYELADNLRLQLVVLEIQEKANKYKYNRDESFNDKKYLIFRIIRINLIIIYSMLVLFEKPLHCYKSTTFYTNKTKEDNKCDKDLQYLNEGFFMNETAYRIIELLFNSIFKTYS